MRLLLPTVLVLACAANAQIPMSKYVRTYNGDRVRGYYFKAPTRFIMRYLQVPDEQKRGTQTVAVYRMKTEPPAFPTARTEQAVFFKENVKSGTRITVIPPLIFQKDEWVGVLGSCASNSKDTRQSNSYGQANFPSRILGNPVTLVRFITQTRLGDNKGNAPVSKSTGSTSRVITWISGQGSAEEYGPASGANPPRLVPCEPFPPSIGFQVKLNIVPGTAQNQGAMWLLGATRTSLKTPFGTLNVGLPFLVTGFVAGPLPAAGKVVALPLPKVNGLLGVRLTNQMLVAVAPKFTMTNGVEWVIGQ